MNIYDLFGISVVIVVFILMIWSIIRYETMPRPLPRKWDKTDQAHRKPFGKVHF